MRLFKGLFQKVDQLVTGRRPVDDELFDELEEALIQADLNVHTALRIVDDLRQATRNERIADAEAIRDRLKQELVEALSTSSDGNLKVSGEIPTVYLMVGVNGVVYL